MFSLTENNRKFSKGLRIHIGNSMEIIKTRIFSIGKEKQLLQILSNQLFRLNTCRY